jgi:hypothetical protein
MRRTASVTRPGRIGRTHGRFDLDAVRGVLGRARIARREGRRAGSGRLANPVRPWEVDAGDRPELGRVREAAAAVALALAAYCGLLAALGA